MLWGICFFVFVLCWWGVFSRPAISPRTFAYCNLNTAVGSEGFGPPKATLLAAVVVARHGDRSAIHQLPPSADQAEWDCGAPSKVQSFWSRFSDFEVVDVTTEQALVDKYYQPTGLGLEHVPCLPGQLTKEGFLQHVQLGQHLRGVYNDRLQLASENYSDWFYSRSTNYPRTIQSAVGLLMGLLAPKGQPKVRIMVHEQDSEEIMHGVGMVTSSKNVELHPGEPESVRQGSCPKAFEFSRKQNAAFTLKPGIKYQLVELFGTGASKLSATDVADQISSRICHSLPFPCSEKGCMTPDLGLTFTAEASRLYCERYAGSQGGLMSANLAMFPFLDEILQSLTERANGKSNRRLTVYVGHDTVIAPVLAALGSTSCGWPPFASRIVFELWDKHDGRSGYVRVLFNGSPILVAGSSEELCDLAQLTAHVHSTLGPSGSFDETCQD